MLWFTFSLAFLVAGLIKNDYTLMIISALYSMTFGLALIASKFNKKPKSKTVENEE